MSEDIYDQVLYNGRWVDKNHFRVFVYNSTGQKLANSYDEFAKMISSGIWFANKADIPQEVKEENQNIPEEKVYPISQRRGKKCQNPSKA